MHLPLPPREPGGDGEKPPFSNPFELGPALRFGHLFVVILLAALANTLVKGAVAVTTGAPGLRMPMLGGLGLMLVGGMAAAWLF